MTDEMMDLQALVEKAPDADFLREMIGFTVKRLMELEVGAITGAAWGEKSGVRFVQRNGYRERDWETRAGTDRAPHPEAPEGELLPGLPRPAAGGGEGADRRDPGGLHPGHLDPLGRQPGAGPRDGRGLEEPGQPALRRDRRTGAGLPQPPARGALSLRLDRRDLPEGAPERPGGLGGGDPRHRRQPARAGARCWGSTSGRRRRRPSGPSSSASWSGAGSAGSSW